MFAYEERRSVGTSWAAKTYLLQINEVNEAKRLLVRFDGDGDEEEGHSSPRRPPILSPEPNSRSHLEEPEQIIAEQELQTDDEPVFLWCVVKIFCSCVRGLSEGGVPRKIRSGEGGDVYWTWEGMATRFYTKSSCARGQMLSLSACLSVFEFRGGPEGEEKTDGRVVFCNYTDVARLFLDDGGRRADEKAVRTAADLCGWILDPGSRYPLGKKGAGDERDQNAVAGEPPVADVIKNKTADDERQCDQDAVSGKLVESVVSAADSGKLVGSVVSAADSGKLVGSVVSAADSGKQVAGMISTEGQLALGKAIKRAGFQGGTKQGSLEPDALTDGKNLLATDGKNVLEEVGAARPRRRSGAARSSTGAHGFCLQYLRYVCRALS